MVKHSIRNLFLASVISLTLAACGNDIKSDIILLDQAVSQSGMNDKTMTELQKEIAAARSPEEFTVAAGKIRDQYQRYHQAINALNFKTDEVRGIRDELSTQSGELVSSLDEFVNLNIRSSVSYTPVQADRVHATIARAENQIQTSEKNTLQTLKKLQALGKDNGVDLQIQ
ncbi:hypothetical protein LVJ82_18085 [Vitreoscilla massiliensis]|uniref:Lipoprotein n=1 Tax=Vitreoscilla massiliensis TaxID=1689272 RepID=A0ABY4E0R8_9NEIS|nr:hypothetical protein [Vitreoscilla massiliensis]UOO89326.1 hypothetical protein LVJ82_18085 [Vitreoscilla massiliensis]